MKFRLFFFLITTQAILDSVAQSQSEAAGRATSSTRAEALRWDTLSQVRSHDTLHAAPPILGAGGEIMLLQETQPFFVRSTTQPVYTTNAAYDHTERKDWYLQQSLAAGLETVIDDRYYFLSEWGASMARYDQFSLLDRDALAVLVSASTAITESLSAGVTWNSAWSFERGFGHNDITFHTVSLHANRIFPLTNGSTLVISPAFTRIWSDPGDYSQTALGLGGRLNIPLSDRTILGFSGRIDSLRFDQFFPEVVSGDRRDLALTASAYLTFRPRENVEITMEILFSDNDSSVSATDLNTGRQVGLYDYSVWTVIPTLRIAINF